MVQTPSANEPFFGLNISDIKKKFYSFRRKISKRYLLIEFGIDSITYCESRVIKDQVHFTKLNRISIDQSAIERGTPTDIKEMGSFLNQIIQEEQIWGHQVGIVLPPQAVLSKIIHLPKKLNYKEAIDYVSNPSSSGFQFPIPLENTDFDLLPLNCIQKDNRNQTKPYFLNSIPKKLIDNVSNTLSAANLELDLLDVAYSALERIAITSMEKLENGEVFILIELSIECTHFYIITLSGPIYVTTLAAIKEFEVTKNYEGALSIEENTINREDYLPISKLDMKVLFNEVKSEIDTFRDNHDLKIREIILSGINSCHPGINNLFNDRFNIKTTILRSLSSKHIGEVSLSRKIAMQDLNRLVGLGLSTIQSDYINEEELKLGSNQINSRKIINDNSSRQKEAKISELSIDNRSKKLNKNITYNENYIPIDDKDNNITKLVSEDIKGKKEDEYSNNLSFDEFLKQNKDDQQGININTMDLVNDSKKNDLHSTNILNIRKSTEFIENKLQETENPTDITSKPINKNNDDSVISENENQTETPILDIDNNLQETENPNDITSKPINKNNDDFVISENENQTKTPILDIDNNLQETKNPNDISLKPKDVNDIDDLVFNEETNDINVNVRGIQNKSKKTSDLDNKYKSFEEDDFNMPES